MIRIDLMWRDICKATACVDVPPIPVAISAAASELTLLLSLLVSRSMHPFDFQMKLRCLDLVLFHILHMDGYFVAIV